MLTRPNALLEITEKVRQLFSGDRCRIQVAALPWRETKDGGEVMLITSRDTGRWVLPKGWPEENESLSESAAREAAEEAGLSGTISPVAEGSYFYDKVRASGEADRCEVHVFALEVETVASKWPERHQRQRKWVTPRQAARMVNEPDLSALLARFRDGRKTRRQG